MDRARHQGIRHERDTTQVVDSYIAVANSNLTSFPFQEISNLQCTNHSHFYSNKTRRQDVYLIVSRKDAFFFKRSHHPTSSAKSPECRRQTYIASAPNSVTDLDTHQIQSSFETCP